MSGHKKTKLMLAHGRKKTRNFMLKASMHNLSYIQSNYLGNTTYFMIYIDV